MFRKAMYLGLLGIIAFSCSVLSGEERTWTSANGAYQVEAEMVRLTGETLTLRRADNGKLISIKISQLSKQDSAYALSQNPGSNEPSASDPSGNSGTRESASDAVNTDQIAQRMKTLAKEHGLATIHGLPVIRRDHYKWKKIIGPGLNRDEHAGALEGFALGKFLDLVALGLSEQAFERIGTGFLYLHFPEDIARKYANVTVHPVSGIIVKSDWKGADEFEKKQSKDSFWENHGEELEKMKIELPLRIILVSEVAFGSYDFTRKGVSMVSEWYRPTDTMLPGLAATYDGIVTVSTPTWFPLFWPAEPDVIKRIPVNNAAYRKAYLARVLTLRKPLVEDKSPHTGSFQMLVTRLESLDLYADEKLQNHLDSIEFLQLPVSVMETGFQSPLFVEGHTPQLNELALAGLLLSERQDYLTDTDRVLLWNHAIPPEESVLHGQRQAHYSLEKKISELLRETSTPALEKERNGLLEEQESFTAQTKARLHFEERPFLSYMFQWRPQQALPERHSKILDAWLKQRVEQCEKRFTLVAKIQRDSSTGQPVIWFQENASHDRLTSSLADILKEQTPSLEQIVALNGLFEPRKIGQDDLPDFEIRELHTEAFRSDDKDRTPLLKFPYAPDLILGIIPEKLILEAMNEQENSLQRALQIEIQVDKLEYLSSGEGGPDGVLLYVTPEKLRLVHHHDVLLEKMLDTKSIASGQKVRIESTKPLQPEVREFDGKGNDVDLTPETLLPLIAKYQPKLLDDENYLDQFMVMRWRLENTNLYGVTPPTQKFFQGARMLPNRETRRQHSGRFKSSLQKWADSLSGRVVARFDKVSFQNKMLGDTPSPAMVNGSDIQYWDGNGKSRGFAAEIDPTKRTRTVFGKDLEALRKQISIAPPYIHLNSPFLIPDSEGNATPLGGGIFGGGKSKQDSVAGIPVATTKTEQIFPLLHVDQEMWIPENGRLDSPDQKFFLAAQMKIMEVELLDQAPPHPWIVAYNNAPENGEKRRKIIKTRDDGQYLLIHVELEKASLVDAQTNKVIFPLTLKKYREVEDTP